eukprot:907697-Pyramimonas_sp.AAC.1
MPKGEDGRTARELAKAVGAFKVVALLEFCPDRLREAARANKTSDLINILISSGTPPVDPL